MRKYFGPLLRHIHNTVDQTMTNALASMDLTAAQGQIMAFITHRETAPCARDIEEALQLTHPTVSGLLSRLEKKGFVEFRPDEQDRRCKRIYILPKGQQCTETMHKTVQNIESRLVQGFTKEERTQFTALLDRAIANMGADLCCRTIEEESETHD